MSASIELQDVRRLDVSPGEVLLVTVPSHTTADQAAEMRDQLGAVLPDGVQVIFKTPDVDVVAARPGDARSTGAPRAGGGG